MIPLLVVKIPIIGLLIIVLAAVITLNYQVAMAQKTLERTKRLLSNIKKDKK